MPLVHTESQKHPSAIVASYEHGSEGWYDTLGKLFGSPYGILTENWEKDPHRGAISRPTRGRWRGEETDGQSVSVATAGNAMRMARHAFSVIGEDAVILRLNGEVSLLWKDGTWKRFRSVAIMEDRPGRSVPSGTWLGGNQWAVFTH